MIGQEPANQHTQKLPPPPAGAGILGIRVTHLPHPFHPSCNTCNVGHCQLVVVVIVVIVVVVVVVLAAAGQVTEDSGDRFSCIKHLSQKDCTRSRLLTLG